MSPTIEASARRFSETMGAHRKGRTESEDSLYSISSRMGVDYLAQEVVRTPDFDGMGRPVSYLVDCLLVDPRYDQGVLHVDGEIHSHAKKERKDATEDERLRSMGFWVARIRNEDVCEEFVWGILEHHHRNVDGYGGPL